MSLADFEYELPRELIAQEPVAVRHESRLMLLKRESHQVSHHRFSDLSALLVRGDVLVVNDTRVIPARLRARRASGGLIDILLLKAESSCPGFWQAMATPLKRLKVGERLEVEGADAGAGVIEVADVLTLSDGHKRLLIQFRSPDQVHLLLSQSGQAPLPPYIHRNHEPEMNSSDLERYQTIFARAPGAVAAPTAGLHFSSEIIERLKEREIELCSVTLHTGPGTFKPISGTLEEHIIEGEEFFVPDQTVQAVNRALSDNRRVIAVGTTSLRALETAGATGRLLAVNGQTTSLYIRPGCEFKIARGLITNFHLSRSSLLVLVSAFAGHRLMIGAYQEAVRRRYRFYSYGDAMIIL